MWLRVLLCLACATLSLPAWCADVLITARPDWVVDAAPGVPTPAELKQASDGEVYTLADIQVRATAESRVRYQRFASQAVNATGVSEIANIEIQFDPSWQRLQLHAINVIRQGRVIAKLPTAKIQVLQREEELAARIFDGSKTASIFLEDVRVGDTVDYAYSTIGRNEVFDGFEFGGLDLQFSVPVSRIHARLLIPDDLAITLKYHNAAPAAVVSTQAGMRLHTWDIRNAPALVVESGAPSWYSPYAMVEWSQFRDWAAVVAWAQPLYQPPGDIGPELEAEVARIARAEPTAAGRMLAALRFAQGEIRYLGVETGRNSHAPHPPALVLQRRFGDCKDKALLTLTLLQRLGIEAHAALVNTDIERGLKQRLPQPAAFDHVLVRARVDGKVYWIDPTLATQDSALANLYQPDFDVSLVVAPGERALSSMKQPGGAHARRKIHAVYDARQSFSKPVHYSIVTVHEGSSAESQRDSFASTNLESVQKDFLEFYANGYPGIKVLKPLALEDDKHGNRVTTREAYAIADIASAPDKRGRRTVDVLTPEVDELLRDPEVTIRKAPLALRFPYEARQTTEVLLSEEWSITPVNVDVRDPAFSFTRTVKPKGKGFIIEDHYTALSDVVAANDMPRYLASLARARADAGYQLYWDDPAAPGATTGLANVNWLVAFVALLALGLFGGLAFLAYRHDPPARTDVSPELTGLSGWLVLLGIVLAITPLRMMVLASDLVTATSLANWTTLTTAGGDSYHPLWAPLLLFEVVGNLGLLVAVLLVLVLYFQRRTNFPRFAIVLFLAGFAIQAIDQWFAGVVLDDATTKDYIELASAGLGSLLWSTYLWRSRRVRSTFVRRLREPPPLFAVARPETGAV